MIPQYCCKGAEHLLDVHTDLVNGADVLTADLHYLHFWHHYCFSEKILSPLIFTSASSRRSQEFLNKRFVLISPITDWNVSPQVRLFIPMDLIVHICYTILSLRRIHGPVENPSSQIKKGGIRICFQIGSNGFLFTKCVCLPLTCLTAMNFQMETWQAASWQRLLSWHT